MKAYDLIQVLWVEDDPKVTMTYPLKAERFQTFLLHVKIKGALSLGMY